MTLLLKSGAVFLHVPKTGGTFVGKVLTDLKMVRGKVGRDHTDFERLFWHDRFHHDDKVFRNLIRRRLGVAPAIDPTSFKFCFVREPLKWYVSYWIYMQGLDWRPWGDERNPYYWSPLAMLNGLGSPDFNTFMANVNRKRPGFVTEMYGWYVRPGVDFVGKLENLNGDLKKALALMGVEVELNVLQKMAPVNEAKAGIAKPAWDPALRRETLRLEYASYVRYGYAVDEAVWNGADAAVPRG